jgi:DNA-binding NarL/FixJ family response regulator
VDDPVKDWDKWEVGEVTMLVKLRVAGWKWKNIARYLKRSEMSCRKKYSRIGTTDGLVKKWTEEETRELEELARKGFSARRIAQRIGRTRNAVLGRAHRIGARIG